MRRRRASCRRICFWYLMGDDFMVADAYLFTVLGWMPGFSIDLNRWPNTEAYTQLVANRPSVASAHAREAEIPPVECNAAATLQAPTVRSYASATSPYPDGRSGPDARRRGISKLTSCGYGTRHPPLARPAPDQSDGSR